VAFLSLCYYSSSNAQSLTTGDCSSDGTINFVTGTTCAEDPNTHAQTGLQIFDGGGTAQQSDFWGGNQGYGTGIYNGGSNNVQVLLHGESINGDATWTYTSQIVSGILQKLTGIKIDGFQYSWEYRKTDDAFASNGRCHGQVPNRMMMGCDDHLEISFTIKDSSGNAVITDTFNYDSNATDGTWYTESGLSWHNTQLGYGTDIASFDISITGGDGGDGGYQNGGSFFAGPQVRRMTGDIIFSQDICAINALHDPSCSGYANALFNQQCTANPLYDPGCPGYTAANLTQQCTANPLYDPACPGYQTAYYTQQCTINPTSDPSCPDYYVAMCKKDALFDSGCSGYSVAYFDQQCSLDPQYDNTCPGYVDLSGNDGDFVVLDPIVDDVVNSDTNIGTETATTVLAPVVVAENTIINSDNVEQSTGFQTIEDDIETEISDLQTMEGETILEEDIEAEIAKLENESETLNTEDGESLTGKASMDDSIEKELAELENTKPDYRENIPGKAMPKVDPVDSKRNKLKLLIAMKAIEAVKELEAAVTLEQQMDIQRRLLALISFVPDFNDYNKEENIDLANFYPPKPTVDHAYARWFLNDPNFGAMEDLQYTGLK